LKKISFAILAALAAVPAFANEPALNEYTVPVREKLRPWATFTLEDAELRVRKGEAKLEYKFPAWLSGKGSLKIQAKGPIEALDKPIYLQGAFVKSCKCTLDADLAHCEIKYRPELPMLSPEGKDRVAEYLRDTIDEPVERENRLQVLEEFVNGPGFADSHEAGGKFERLKVRYR